MRLMIVGGGGQVGRKLAFEASKNGHDVIRGFSTNVPSGVRGVTLDKSKPEAIDRIVSELETDAVVDAGGIRDVDYCEIHPGQAFLVNAIGTGALAASCAKNGVKYAFVSSDYVFNGSSPPYLESDPPNPINVYGMSKLAGELLALNAGEDHMVVRPSTVFSWTDKAERHNRPLNFAEWVVSKLRAHEEVTVVDDQITCPTLADDLARAILAALETKARGIIHTVGRTALTRYEFVLRIARATGLEGLVKPVKTHQLRQVARRPPDSTLQTRRIEMEIGYHMMDVDEALEHFAAQLKGGHP